MTTTPIPDWSAQTVYVEDQPVSIYTASVPGGKPLVFLHGWGLSPRSYRPVLDAVAAHGFTVTAPAMPGFGGSAPLDDAARDTLPRLAERLHQALDGDGLDLSAGIPLVGHSLGAGLAVHMSLAHPGLASRLILICPIGGAGANLTTWLHLAGGLRHEIGNRPFARARDAVPTFLRHPHTAAATGIAAKHADLTAGLGALAERGIPVTLVAADHDGIVDTDRLRHLPGVEVIEVTGTHGWLLADPQAAADLVAGATRQDGPSARPADTAS